MFYVYGLFVQQASFWTTNSARVLEGIWNKTPVAVKILKSNEGVTPSFEVRLDACIRRINF